MYANYARYISLSYTGLHEFEGLKNPEVNDFRWKMKHLGSEVARIRQNKTWLEKVAYQFPPRISSSDEIPSNCKARMRETSYFVDSTSITTYDYYIDSRFQNTEVWPEQCSEYECTDVLIRLFFCYFQTAFKFNVSCTTTPTELLHLIMNKKSLTLNSRGENPNDFLLKVCGQEEYLIGEYPLVRFLYIQECLSRDITPTVVVVSVNSVSGSYGFYIALIRRFGEIN